MIADLSRDLVAKHARRHGMCSARLPHFCWQGQNAENCKHAAREPVVSSTRIGGG